LLRLEQPRYPSRRKPCPSIPRPNQQRSRADIGAKWCLHPNKFDRPSPVVNDKGETLDQRDWILKVNRDKHGGEVHSDLAGFKFPCKEQDGGLTTCTEPIVLNDPDSEEPPFDPDAVAQVHHVVPMKDLRCCAWGTNSYKNAAVISQKLNRFFTNNNPPVEEVEKLNGAEAYTP
jgi:hypothetical protein